MLFKLLTCGNKMHTHCLVVRWALLHASKCNTSKFWNEYSGYVKAGSAVKRDVIVSIVYI